MTPGSSAERTKTRLRGVAPVEPPKPGAPPKEIGRYQVLDVIGRGAMGVVYKARDPLLDRVVAVKTIYAPQQLGERVRRAFLERFEREAKAAARIAHPAIVTIFDVGLSQENPFLVMEYLPGETLADRLDRERMPLAQAVECARELASALGQAHKERIVHRDVKPANVLHAGESRWKLTDFGIARLPDSDLTQIGTFMGTPGYAPPEAIREGRYTVQADVFAWGAVFYELLCGRVPYEGPDTETTNRTVIKSEPPSPRQYDPTIPELLAQVASRALAHDPARRYANGAEAAGALKEAWERSLAAGAVPMSAFATNASVRVPASTLIDPPQREANAPVAIPPSPSRPAPKPAAPAKPAVSAKLPEARGLFQQAAATPEDPAAPDHAAPQHAPDHTAPPLASGPQTAILPENQRPAPRARDEAQVIKTGPLRIQQPPPAKPASGVLSMILVALGALALGAALTYFFFLRGR